jgi:hypothetical protein
MYRSLILLVAITVLCVSVAESQQVPKNVKPKFEAVAETPLLMEGLLQSNFRGLEKILRGVPKDAETWTFARGQALLIAETGNLLLIRPPRDKGQEAWVNRSMELRDAATRLARLTAAKDTVRARAGLVEVADVCNRCHESFRVPNRITVFGEEK